MGYLLPNIVKLDFGFALLETVNFANFISGTTIPHIYFKDYGEKRLFVPTTLEQAAIGSFFNNLNTQITAQAQKLEQLKRLKARCLQGMFV